MIRWNRNTHYVGQTVRNKANRWIGHVAAVECMVCGADVDFGFSCGHVRSGYSITVAQVMSKGEPYLKPWCRPEDYEIVRSTFWRRLLDCSV